MLGWHFCFFFAMFIIVHGVDLHGWYGTCGWALLLSCIFL